MFTTLLTKEIQETIQTYRFLIATLLCIVLVPLGMYVTMKNYEQRLSDYRDNDNIYHQRAEGRLYYSFQGEGYRPPSPLSVFSIGLDYYMPSKALTSRNDRIMMINDQGIDNAQSLLFGKIDFLFNVGFVLSMLALIFTFSSIAGEKESATFRLVLSNPVPRWMIVVSKVLGNYLVFLMPFTVSLGLGFLILIQSRSIGVLSAGILPHIALIILVSLLFLFAMFCLGLLVSARTEKSLVAIVLLMFVWVVFVMIIPKVSPMIAEVLYPVKSTSVLTQEKELARANLEKEVDTKRRELFEEVLGRFGVDYSNLQWPVPEDMGQAYDAYDKEVATLNEDYEKRIMQALRRIEQDYQNKKNVQAAIAVNLSRLSPVSCLSYIITELSGTGLLELKNFSAMADRFQEKVDEAVYSKYTVKSYGNTSGSTTSSTSSSEDFDPQTTPVPHLTDYRHPGIEVALETVWIDIVLLAFYAIIFFTASFVSFLRYDVR